MINTVMLQDTLLTILSYFGSAIIGYGFSKAQRKADIRSKDAQATKLEIDGILDSVQIFKDTIVELKQQVTDLKVEVDILKEENRNLTNQIIKLKKIQQVGND